jgi:hypothetical protein
MRTLVTKEALLEAAVRYYRDELKASLEPEHNDEYVAIDPENRRFAVRPNSVDAFEELELQGSEPPFALLRVGRDATWESTHPL